MITIEKLLEKATKVFYEEGEMSMGIAINMYDIPDLIREYTTLAIKADRENAANHVKISRESTGEGNSSESYISDSFEGDLGYEDYIPVEYTIYKDSIINAPNIELL